MSIRLYIEQRMHPDTALFLWLCIFIARGLLVYQWDMFKFGKCKLLSLNFQHKTLRKYFICLPLLGSSFSRKHLSEPHFYFPDLYVAFFMSHVNCDQLNIAVGFTEYFFVPFLYVFSEILVASHHRAK